MKIRPNKCGNHCTRVNHVNVTLEGERILNDVNFSLLCGEMITLIGKNGAGKSTMLKALLGEVPYEGEILFEDRRNGKRGDMRIGYVPQQLSFDKNTPTTVYDFFASCISKVPVWLWKKKSVYEKIKKELERFQAQDLIDKRMGDLSGGELQRVLLSVATCPKPNLLILDEPISGIDREGTILFYQILDHLKKEDDLSILMVSHDLDFTYEYSDRVLLINQTVIEDGTPQEVYQSPAFVEVFGKLPFVEPEDGEKEKKRKRGKEKYVKTEKAAPYDASYSHKHSKEKSFADSHEHIGEDSSKKGGQ